MVYIVCSPGFREGTNFGKILPRGKYIFFKTEGGILQGGTQISDISLDHPGKEMPTQSPKKFFEYL